MSDKLVTHADLQALRGIRMAATDHGSFYRDDQPAKPGALVLLDRLIAAAEADVPPLPEGWVLLDMKEGHRSVVWHSEGHLYRIGGPAPRESIGYPDTVGYFRDRLTPLRPTITEADVERAAVVLMDRIPTQTYRDVTRDMLKAAGIEVQP